MMYAIQVAFHQSGQSPLECREIVGWQKISESYDKSEVIVLSLYVLTLLFGNI